MNAKSRLKSEFQRLLVYFVVFVIFFMFAIAAVFAMNRVIRYYTERETDVFATNLQLDLDAMLLEAEGGLADPEIRHLLEIYARLHDLDIVVTDRKGVVQVGSVRELTAGEPLFAQRSVFSLAERYLMREDTLHFLDKAWVNDRGVLDVTYCTTRPVIGTDSRMVILARNSKLVAVLSKAMIFFFIGLGILFLFTIFLIHRILSDYRQRIIELATIDELTGLANRKSFIRQYSERIDRGIPDGAMLFMLDVDKFKLINDNYGHAAGDQALAFVAKWIQSLMDQQCMAGRWGGDEFIGIYTDGRVKAGEKLKQLLNVIRETPMRLEDGTEVRLTTSIGAVMVNKEQSLNKIVELADAALYQSKEAGRDRLTVNIRNM
jgi:diguanylate cyclase (GGDEF)-like protein